jgi:Cys-tRNA(Pro)/Cys-tRNA(Cys) deacylase
VEEPTPVTQTLAARQVPFRTFRHAAPVHSLEQAARERDQTPEQVVRSLVFRIAEGEYVMVLVAGPDQISWQALRRHLGQSRLSLASQEEVLAVTGHQVGTVAPFGLPQSLPILVDQSVMAQTEISLGSGVRGLAVILSTADLLSALDGYETVDLRRDP